MSEKEYWYLLDPYPHQTKKTNKLYKFFDYLREGKLVSTKCKNCGVMHWPPRTICRECISDDLEWVEFPKRAKIYTYTVQVGGIPPGYESPLIYALVDFDNGMRMMSRLVDTDPDDLKEGKEVELKVVEIPNDRVLPLFKLVQ